MQFQFLATVELFFKQLNGCSFAWAELIFFDLCSFLAVCFVMSAFVSRMERSTIVEGQRIRTNEQKMRPTCT